jgi:hypothetical protein
VHEGIKCHLSSEQEHIKDSIHFPNDKIHTYFYDSLLKAAVVFQGAGHVNNIVLKGISQEKFKVKTLGKLRNTYDDISHQEYKKPDALGLSGTRTGFLAHTETFFA